MLLPGTKPRRRPRTGEKKVFANQCFYGIIKNSGKPDQTDLKGRTDQ